MPVWAQWAGEIFPVTLRVVRGILRKGNGVAEALPELWPIAAFTAAVRLVAI
jgi:ABC-2 type transport system permease protein